MNIKNYKNNKGFTLVELIATISLLTIVIALSSTLIIQLMRTDAKTSDQISLSQETNVLISELRSQYESEDFELEYTDEHKLSFPKRTNDDTLKIEQLKIINNGQELSKPGSKINVDMESPLHVEITTKNKDSKSFTLETTWENFNDYPLSVVLNSGEDANKACMGFDKIDDFKNIIDDGEVYNDWENRNTCIYKGNTQFIQTSMGPWNFCETTSIQQGNAKFINQVTLNNVIFKVTNNLFAKNKLTFDENAKLYVENNAKVDGAINLTPGVMSVKNLYVKNNISLHEFSTLNSICSSRIDGSLLVARSSKLSIGGNLFVKSGLVTLQENTVTSVSGNAEFFNGLKMTSNAKLKVDKDLTSSQDTLFQENVLIETEGDATFGDDLKMMGSAKLKVGGDFTIKNNLEMQDDNKIYVDGDAHFKGNIEPDWSKGTICASGQITINGNVGNEIVIKSNEKNCK